jgi:hypothetical protein
MDFPYVVQLNIAGVGENWLDYEKLTQEQASAFLVHVGGLEYTGALVALLSLRSGEMEFYRVNAYIGGILFILRLTYKGGL